jgi:hypothetical protein
VHAVPAVEYLPAPHCVQAELMVLPEGDEKPEEQEAQTFASVKVFDVAPGRAYLPTGHVSGRQEPPLPVEYVPAIQSMQLALDVLPADEDLPAGQLVQTVPAVEYVPATHCVQAELDVLPAGDDKPAKQEAQTLVFVKVFDVAPGTAYLPAGQVIAPEQAADVNLVVDPYVPAGQLMQLEEPAVE